MLGDGDSAASSMQYSLTDGVDTDVEVNRASSAISTLLLAEQTCDYNFDSDDQPKHKERKEERKVRHARLPPAKHSKKNS